jgi:hypothetical protein
MGVYCVECKRKGEIEDPKKVTLKNARSSAQGIYPALSVYPKTPPLHLAATNS